MGKLCLGQVDYLNVLPVYNAIDEGKIQLDAEIVKDAPARLNQQFLNGELDLTPISSIEYARNADKCLIVPDLSISADGTVESILLISKIPVTELEGKKIALTTSSATSVVLLKVLMEHYYHVSAEYESFKPDLWAMLENCDAALLIGDDALIAGEEVKKLSDNPLYVTDLGEVWKQFTGEAMVYAVWVVHRDFAEAYPEKVAEMHQALLKSKEIGYNEKRYLAEKAVKRNPKLSVQLIEDYFETIRHDFDENYRRALLTFYDYAYKSGLIDKRVKLAVWGESDDSSDFARKSS